MLLRSRRRATRSFPASGPARSIDPFDGRSTRRSFVRSSVDDDECSSARVRGSEGARRVHRVARFGSVPFRSVSSSKNFFILLRMSVRGSRPFGSRPFFRRRRRESSSSSFSPGTTLRDATAASSIDRPIDHVEAKQTGGGYRRDGSRGLRRRRGDGRVNRGRATGIRSETRFHFPRSFPFPFPPAGARSIRSLCRSSTPPRRRVNGDDGLFSIDDAGREEGEKTDATRRDPPRSGVGFACERRMDLADGTDRRMRIYTSFET